MEHLIVRNAHLVNKFCNVVDCMRCQQTQPGGSNRCSVLPFPLIRRYKLSLSLWALSSSRVMILSDMARDYGGREESNKTRVKTVGAGLQTKTTNQNALNTVCTTIKRFYSRTARNM